jgi:hypothetical protein
MKVIILNLLISIFATSSVAKEKTISSNDFRINGLHFTAKRNDIIKTFGKPQKIFEPKYECGFLSQAEQGKTFYSLQYPSLKFTGNESEHYILEKVDLRYTSKLTVTYKGKLLSHKTTKVDFETLFSIKLNNDGVKLYHENADDALLFTFTDGLLSKIEYWSPC